MSIMMLQKDILVPVVVIVIGVTISGTNQGPLRLVKFINFEKLVIVL